MPDAVQQLSPLDAMLASELPGIGEYALPAPCSYEELERLPIHTAERFFNSEPKCYAIACALFFGERMSYESICRILRISRHTLRNIVLREMSGRTADQWRADMLTRLKAGATLAASALVDLLADPESVECAGIKGVALASRELTHAHELLSGRPTDRREAVAAPTDDAAARAYLDRLARPAVMDLPARKGEVSGDPDEAESAVESGASEASHD